MEKYNLRILPNNLIICDIAIAKTRDDEFIKCQALIDTGAEMSLICESLFKKLEIDIKDVVFRGTSSLDLDVNTKVCFINTRIPFSNWSQSKEEFYVKDFSHREEYQAIIGINLLKNFKLHYDGIKEEAFLFT